MLHNIASQANAIVAVLNIDSLKIPNRKAVIILVEAACMREQMMKRYRLFKCSRDF